MTAPREDATWRAFEARLAAVEPLIPDVPRWTGPAESPADGTLNVVRGATRQAAGSTQRPGGMVRPLRLAAGFVAVAVVAVGLAWFAGSREGGTREMRPGYRAGPTGAGCRSTARSSSSISARTASSSSTIETAPAVVDLTTSPAAADRLVVYQAVAAIGCAAGSSGEYEWHLEGPRITFCRDGRVLRRPRGSAGPNLGSGIPAQQPQRSPGTAGRVPARLAPTGRRPDTYRQALARPCAQRAWPAAGHRRLLGR